MILFRALEVSDYASVQAIYPQLLERRSAAVGLD
jgi:hypothetical protein